MQRFIRNFRRWQQSLRPSLGKLFLMLAFVFTWGYGINFMQLTELSKQLQSAEVQLSTQMALAQSNANDLIAANLNVELERQSVKSLQSALAEANAKSRALQEDLSFFKSVMAPEGVADGVYVETAELEETSTAGRYFLTLAIAQQKKRRTLVKGTLTGTISGTVNGKTKKLDLLEHLNKDFKNHFGFKYFQLIEGELTLPEGFHPEKLIIKLKVPASRWSKAQQAEGEFNVDQIIIHQD